MTTYVDVQLHLKIDEDKLHELATIAGLNNILREAGQAAMLIRRHVGDMVFVEQVERIHANPFRGVARELCTCPACPRPEHASEKHR